MGAAALGLNLLCASAEENLLRQWQSKDGQHTIQASLESFNSITNQVTLTKKDSSSIKVPLLKLSSADQTFIRSQNATPGQAADSVKLYGITWQPEIDDALAQAKGKNRPVMWFSVLGKLDDGM